MSSDPLSRPLNEIVQDLRDRRVTARELVEIAIARHERLGERLHAYSYWGPEQARAVALAADAAFVAGVSAGPLQGLPVSIKDLFAAEGYPCFAGSSRRLPADPWERDGPLVAALRRQLGVIMGKTHMVEFAFGGTGHNSHWGAPYNPWDSRAHRAPGGSSSGAGISLLEGSALPGLLARSVSDVAYGFMALDPAGMDPVGFITRAATRDLAGVRMGAAIRSFGAIAMQGSPRLYRRRWRRQKRPMPRFSKAASARSNCAVSSIRNCRTGWDSSIRSLRRRCPTPSR